MNVAVCTLFEGHYHMGVGALANSLSASGFQGILWAGYRGEIPPWAGAIREETGGISRFRVSETFEIAFVLLETTLHFAYFKPDFLERVLSDLARGCASAIYIDPDIVVKCPWHLIERWPSGGVALVQDVHSAMPPRHPMRLAWLEVLRRRGLAATCPRDRYYSTGFVGIDRGHRVLLGAWKLMIGVVLSEIGADCGVKHGDAASLFHSTDQDALNMALMTLPIQVNAAGSEAMDFATGGYLLSHAIGTPKPWEGKFLQEAIKGFPPTLSSKAFLKNASGPIQMFAPARKAWMALMLGVGSAIGRFYRRA